MVLRFSNIIRQLVYTSFIFLLIFENPFNINNFIETTLNINNSQIFKFKLFSFISLFIFTYFVKKKIFQIYYTQFENINILKLKIAYKLKISLSCIVGISISFFLLFLLIIINRKYLFSLNTSMLEFYFYLIIFIIWLFINFLTITISIILKHNKIKNIVVNFIDPLLNKFLEIKTISGVSFTKLSYNDKKIFIKILNDGLKFLSPNSNIFLMIIGFNNIFNLKYIEQDKKIDTNDDFVDSEFINIIDEVDKLNFYILGTYRIYLS